MTLDGLPLQSRVQEKNQREEVTIVATFLSLDERSQSGPLKVVISYLANFCRTRMSMTGETESLNTLQVSPVFPQIVVV